MKARFWIYRNGGFVRLKLKLGQFVNFYRKTYDDEGWSQTYESYYFDPRTQCVWSHVFSDGRDCDGYICTCDSFWVCSMVNLKSQHLDSGILGPLWEEAGFHVREELKDLEGAA
jgi:hypothetical protein